MDTFRADGKAMFVGISEVIDYSKGVGALPKENVLKFVFDGGTWFAIRPSGTEPKLKIYYSVCESDRNEAENTLKALRDKLTSVVGG